MKYAFMLLGCGLMALAFNPFLTGAKIVPGGVSGLAMIANTAFPSLSVGFLSFLFNLPLLALGYRRLGGEFIKYTIFCSIALPVLLELFEAIPAPTQNPLVCGTLGGALVGIGLGIVFSCGGSTGGVDIVARVVCMKRKNMTLGQVMLIADAFVTVLAGVAFKSLISAAYAVVTIYISAFVTDFTIFSLKRT